MIVRGGEETEFSFQKESMFNICWYNSIPGGCCSNSNFITPNKHEET
jgi:hypothetical protein